MIVALLALFVALGGPAQAAKLINGARIKAGSVSSKQIKDGTVKARDLNPRTLRSLKATPAGSVGPVELAENAVGTRSLAPNSVLTGHIADNSLTAADLGANSVMSDEVADNAVGQSEIRTNGVGAEEIAPNVVDGAKVVDGSLSIRDLARQVGTLRWPVPELAAGACDVAEVPIATIDVAGDFLLISPTTPWPAALVYTVNGTSARNAFKVQACNRGKANVPAATHTFNYAVLAF